MCDDHWDNEDASVACSQLGFSRYGKCPFNILKAFMDLALTLGCIFLKRRSREQSYSVY